MRKIWIDCDPGVDDAVALSYLAANREQFAILGVSTVAGNQTIEKVTANALALTEFLNLDVPVVQGAEEPLVADLGTGAGVHGETGLGRHALPKSGRKPVSSSFSDYIAEMTAEWPKEERMTLVALGPLTNLAMLIKSKPQIRDRIEEIIFMGGAAWGGNVTASAEFNIYTDPEAAKIVLDAGIPAVMCGLDVTMKCGFTRRQISKLCQIGGRVSGLCGEWIAEFLSSPVYEVQPVLPVHDVVPIMYLLHPEIFGGEKLPVDVDCSMGLSRGRTICDRRYLLDEEELHVKVLLKADGNAFQEYLIESLYEMDAESN